MKDDDETHQKRCLALIHKKKVCKNSLPTVFTPFLPHIFFGYFGTPQPTRPGVPKPTTNVAGSLEMANLAVRHVDTELAEATKHAYQQATGEVGEGYSTEMLRFRAPMEICKGVFCWVFYLFAQVLGFERWDWKVRVMRVFLLLLFLHVSMKQFLFERCIVCCYFHFRSWYYVCSL